MKLQNKPVLIDVRTRSEFAAGSVADAINIPFSTINTAIDTFDKKTNIVVFCKSGFRSKIAKLILQSKGYTNVINGGSLEQVSATI